MEKLKINIQKFQENIKKTKDDNNQEEMINLIDLEETIR